MSLSGSKSGTYAEDPNKTFTIRHPEAADIPTLHEDLQGIVEDTVAAIKGRPLQNIPPPTDTGQSWMQYSMEINTSLDGAVWGPHAGFVPPSPPNATYLIKNGTITTNTGGWHHVYWFSFGQWIDFFNGNGWKPDGAVGMSLTYRNAQGGNAADKALVINAARRRYSFPTATGNPTYPNAAFCASAFNAHNSETFNGNVGLTANLIYRFDRVKSRTDLAAMGVKAKAATPSDVLLQDPALLALENMPEIHGPA